MRRLVTLLLVSLPLGTARAQPADCPTTPGPTASVPLTLDLQGLPGVPRGLSGYLGADVPAAPPGGTVCQAEPLLPPSRDALAGPPGNVLAGSPPQRRDGVSVAPAVARRPARSGQDTAP